MYGWIRVVVCSLQDVYNTQTGSLQGRLERRVTTHLSLSDHRFKRGFSSFLSSACLCQSSRIYECANSDLVFIYLDRHSFCAIVHEGPTLCTSTNTFALLIGRSCEVKGARARVTSKCKCLRAPCDLFFFQISTYHHLTDLRQSVKANPQHHHHHHLVHHRRH